MKTRMIISLAILMTLMVAGLSGLHPVMAQELSIQDSFDEPALPGWEHSPQAQVVEGVLCLKPGGFALRVGDWSDITLSVKLQVSGTGRVVVGYYFHDNKHYLALLGEEEIRLEKEVDGQRTGLGSAQAGIKQDTWINLKISAVDGQHQVILDDKLQLTVTDPEPLSGGAVMFTVEGEITAELDDFQLSGTQNDGAHEDQDAPQENEPTSPVSLQTETTPAPGSGSLIDDFFSSQASILDLSTFLINIVLAVGCAYVLGLLYIHWGTSLSNRRKFAGNFLLMTVTTTFIILVVRSSVALSLGLVGALSIVRFRTAVKEPEELTYLFVAIGIGIGLGDNQRLITLVALAAIVILVALRRLFQKNDADVNLHLSITSRDAGKVELEQITRALQPHVAKIRLLRLDENRQMLEAGFLVEFARSSDFTKAKQALRELSEDLEITFMDNKGLW